MAIHTLYRTIQDIKGTNTLRVTVGTEGIRVAEELLSAHATDVPVVDESGRIVGVISEWDLLKAIKSGKDLGSLKVEEIMNRKIFSVQETTPIETAMETMEKNHLPNLPVVENGFLMKVVSRHDLLRAMVNAGLGLE